MRNRKFYVSLVIVILMTTLMNSTVLADPPDKMWVKSIKMSVSGDATHIVKANLVIWDSDGDGTGRATVTTRWTLPDRSTKTTMAGSTNSDGQVSISVSSTLSGRYRMCVTNVSRTGYIYDPTRNLIKCCSIVVP
jgi:hypothetical protein